MSSGVGVWVLGLQDWLEGQSWDQPCLTRDATCASAQSAVLDLERGMKRLRRSGGTFGGEGSGCKMARWSLVTGPFYHPVGKSMAVISYPYVMRHQPRQLCVCLFKHTSAANCCCTSAAYAAYLAFQQQNCKIPIWPGRNRRARREVVWLYIFLAPLYWSTTKRVWGREMGRKCPPQFCILCGCPVYFPHGNR